ncbi:hypothetical protein SPI_00483 [Niveomyces insectorum RCEF 264]|uniref:Uncharacterized protein n=1 Tax=Niveomyces insectorum RCEF 264 TaxID=1081102 RepID=A0A168A5W9_9HYPO|nr:hypothetical protein SPI_00483 [Niveomyces insectorum RCEF 264]
MLSAQVCTSFKSYMSRLHRVLSIRRKKTKPRLVISAPFDFKKEDSLLVLPGVSNEELTLLREKAAASVVGSALSSPYPDSPPRGPFGRPQGRRSIISSSSSSINTTAPHRGRQPWQQRHRLTRSISTPLYPTVPKPSYQGCCRCCHSLHPGGSSATSSTVHVNKCSGGGGGSYSRSERASRRMSFYTHPSLVVLASTEPYAPSGLTCPSATSSPSSSTASFMFIRDHE